MNVEVNGQQSIRRVIPLQTGTILELRPDLWFCTGPGGEVQIIADGELKYCGAGALSTMDLFSTPKSVAEAAAVVTRNANSSGEWQQVMGTILQLYNWGALVAVADGEGVIEPDCREVSAGSSDLVVNTELQVDVTFKTKVRGKAAKTGRFTMRDQPEVCRALIELNPGSPASQLTPHLVKQFFDLGVLTDNGGAPEKIVYKCRLDTELLHLVPYRKHRLNGRGRGESHIVNPSVRLQRVGPVESQPESEQAIVWMRKTTADVLWVEDLRTGISLPYELSSRVSALIKDLLAGDVLPSQIEEEDVAVLVSAGVIVSADEASKTGTENSLGSLSDGLSAGRYAVIRNLIPPLQIAALRSYIRDLDANGFLLPDTLTGKHGLTVRYVMHNNEVTRFIHHRISGAIEGIVGEELKPSYSFISAYKSGAFLPPHIDRDQCAWNISLLVDSEPELERESSWPIYLRVGSSPVEVKLGIGDAVLYQGTTVPHWRDKLPEGQTATLLLFHFVHADFSGSPN